MRTYIYNIKYHSRYSYIIISILWTYVIDSLIININDREDLSTPGYFRVYFLSHCLANPRYALHEIEGLISKTFKNLFLSYLLVIIKLYIKIVQRISKLISNLSNIKFHFENLKIFSRFPSRNVIFKWLENNSLQLSSIFDADVSIFAYYLTTEYLLTVLTRLTSFFIGATRIKKEINKKDNVFESKLAEKFKSRHSKSHLINNKEPSYFS